MIYRRKRHFRPFDPGKLPGTRKSRLPAAFQPQLTTLVDEVPRGDDWLHEIKYDGYRALCRIERGRAAFFTRDGKDWTARFGPLASAASQLPVRQALLDGEVVVMENDGATNFQALQEALSKKETDRLFYYVFDILHLDGYDLTQVPLLARKEALKTLFSAVEKNRRVRFSDHVFGEGQAFYEKACQLGLEGVISKRKNSLYRPGRSREWLKIKCHASQEVVIGGFTDPSGSRTGLGALVLGAHNDKGELVYAGKVGTGFTQQSLQTLRARLDSLVQDSPPFSNPPRGLLRGTHWVKPELVAEIEFTGWTRDGLLRHPSFKGLREDKPPSSIKREYPQSTPRSSTQSSPGEDGTRVAGVKITHPDRILYPEQGITKRELAAFYEQIADWILPHLSGRPLVLVRCPEGREKQCFYQKHAKGDFPDSIRRISIREQRSVGAYAMVDSLPGLISLAQMGVLEIHTWGSKSDRLEYPDRLTFDLDPDPNLPWKPLMDAAQALRRKLSNLGLHAFLKTTGGKGLHLVVPIAPRHLWDEIKEFCKRVADSMVREAPERFISTMSKTKRTNKIFVDYLRNSRGATAVAAYSTRARPGAPVSTPLDWRELTAEIRSDQFTVRNLPERLAHLRRDPWEDYETARRAITAAMRRKLK